MTKEFKLPEWAQKLKPEKAKMIGDELLLLCRDSEENKLSLGKYSKNGETYTDFGGSENEFIEEEDFLKSFNDIQTPEGFEMKSREVRRKIRKLFDVDRNLN